MTDHIDQARELLPELKRQEACYHKSFEYAISFTINELETLISILTAFVEARGAEYDPASDERWNAGVDFALMQLCAVLKVDPKTVNWDAATETLDGDVGSVAGNILEKAMGDDWRDALKTQSPTEENT